MFEIWLIIGLIQILFKFNGVAQNAAEVTAIAPTTSPASLITEQPPILKQNTLVICKCIWTFETNCYYNCLYGQKHFS